MHNKKLSKKYKYVLQNYNIKYFYYYYLQREEKTVSYCLFFNFEIEKNINILITLFK